MKANRALQEITGYTEADFWPSRSRTSPTPTTSRPTSRCSSGSSRARSRLPDGEALLHAGGRADLGPALGVAGARRGRRRRCTSSPRSRTSPSASGMEQHAAAPRRPGPAHRPDEPAPLRGGAPAPGRPLPALRRARGAVPARPRPLQVRQRHARPQGGRPPAQGRGAPHPPAPARHRRRWRGSAATSSRSCLLDVTPDEARRVAEGICGHPLDPVLDADARDPHDREHRRGVRSTAASRDAVVAADSRCTTPRRWAATGRWPSRPRTTSAAAPRAGCPWQQGVRRALNEQRFEVHAQPIVELARPARSSSTSCCCACATRTASCCRPPLPRGRRAPRPHEAPGPLGHRRGRRLLAATDLRLGSTCPASRCRTASLAAHIEGAIGTPGSTRGGSSSRSPRRRRSRTCARRSPSRSASGSLGCHDGARRLRLRLRLVRLPPRAAARLREARRRLRPRPRRELARPRARARDRRDDRRRSATTRSPSTSRTPRPRSCCTASASASARATTSRGRRRSRCLARQRASAG